MIDLVQRLRYKHSRDNGDGTISHIVDPIREEAADEIESLRTQLAEAQAKLQEAERDAARCRETLRNLLWAATERDKKNRIRQFDEFVDNAKAAIDAAME